MVRAECNLTRAKAHALYRLYLRRAGRTLSMSFFWL